MERLPTGGKRQEFATRCASCRDSTWGITMPWAPLSRMREACQCSRPETRTTGVTPTVRAAAEICAAVSRSIELCSQSMNIQSKPEVLAIWAMATGARLRYAQADRELAGAELAQGRAVNQLAAGGDSRPPCQGPAS